MKVTTTRVMIWLAWMRVTLLRDAKRFDILFAMSVVEDVSHDGGRELWCEWFV